MLDPRFPEERIRGLACKAATHFPQYLDPHTTDKLLMHYATAVRGMSNKSEPIAGNVLQKRAYGGPARLRGIALPTINITSIRT